MMHAALSLSMSIAFVPAKCFICSGHVAYRTAERKGLEGATEYTPAAGDPAHKSLMVSGFTCTACK